MPDVSSASYYIILHWVNSIKLYMFGDYSMHPDFGYPVFRSPLHWKQNVLTASSLTAKDFKISTSPKFDCRSLFEFWTGFFFTFLVLEVTASTWFLTFEAVASSLTPTDESLYDIPLAESVSNKIKEVKESFMLTVVGL